MQGVGAGWKKEDPAKLQADMEAAQLAADESRFDCARKFADIESRKRHEFLNVMLSTMEAHHRHYKQSSEVCSPAAELEYLSMMLILCPEHASMQRTCKSNSLNQVPCRSLAF